MRINKYVARASGLSRRVADERIAKGLVKINGQVAGIGSTVDAKKDQVTLAGKEVALSSARYVLLNKPVGYVSSRAEQGDGTTLYKLLPEDLSHLKIVGRLDKDSSGLILLTDDGDFAQKLTHPSNKKLKRYEVVLHKVLSDEDFSTISGGNGGGVEILDGFTSSFTLSGKGPKLIVEMREGKNRQIRRTFGALGYTVLSLHRVQIGALLIEDLRPGEWRELKSTMGASNYG